MARKTFDEIVEEMAAEERAAQTETQETTETAGEPPKDWAQEPPSDWSKPEDKKADEPPKEEVEDKPAEELKPEAEAPKADPIIDEIETTNTTIRKRLEKQAKSYEQKLADKDAEWQKKLDELKAQFEQKKPEVKTRDNFEHDEEYVAYLTQQQIEKDRAEQKRIKDSQDAEDAKKKAEEEAAAEELKSRQNRFLNNIDQCFDGDAKTTLLKRIQYANSKGLGELLDANPAASDYLLSSPKGPIVLAKLLDASQPEYFRRVFPVGGISPLEQFAELKDIERTAMAERNGQPSVQTTAAPAAPRPKLGKPGAQGSGGTAGDPMVDPKARRDYVRKVMGY